MELTMNQMYHLVERFPDFDNAYETVSQKGYSPDYNVALAIPTGKKNFAWFTFYRNSDVCYLFDLNKEKKIVKSTQIMKEDNNTLGKGTILYGTTVVDEETNVSYFVIEDIYFYKGASLAGSTFYDKLFYIKSFLDTIQSSNTSVIFKLPVLWSNIGTSPISSVIPPDLVNEIAYQTHHVQYRTMTNIMPHINVLLNMKINTTTESQPTKQSVTNHVHISTYTMDLFKPQYRQKTVFTVSADVQYDIYHLHAYGKNNAMVYYGIAYIPDYKTSVFMNGLFRTIRENTNLDYIEESDDEDDFQNIEEDRYVDLKKSLSIECIFHTKFKRWIPMKIAPSGSKIIHISRIVKDYYQ